MTDQDQIAQYRQAYLGAQERLHALADPLSDDAFNWRSDPRRWSIGECIVHLNKIGAAYGPVLSDGVARSPAGAGPFRYGWFSRLFIGAVRPGSRAVPTAPAMKPPRAPGDRSAIDKARALEGLDRTTDDFVAIVDASAGRDLTAVRVASPFASVLRLPVGAFLEAMGLHALRHTGQAERVAAAPGFPAG